MELLDDLSGFEFEDLMEDVFRHLGYENIRQGPKTADVGRDVIMEEVVDGTRRAVVVECKHTDSVGRPVVQKLHSAVATYDFTGPKRGILVTTGRFTGSATEYAAELRRSNDPYPIELIDGTDLRSLAEKVGLDLYNGRIEVLCEETLRPFDPAGRIDSPVREAFRDVENIDEGDLPAPSSHVEFRPVLSVTARIDATFETTVGVIHRVNGTDTLVIHADRGRPSVADSGVQRLVTENYHSRIDLDIDTFGDDFDVVETKRFGQSETEYKDWAIGRFQAKHTTTVRYTGDNNVTYTKTCEPKQSDIAIRSISPVYLPAVRMVTKLGPYSYPYKYFAAGPSRVTIEDKIHRCVQCKTTKDRTYTYCANCGSINCPSHTKTERLEGTPICTGCAVTERFAYRTKYFYSEDNLETFREEYAAMPIHRKVEENPYLMAAIGLVGFILLWASLSIAGFL